ncbi:MAG: NDP-sugar synthase [Actinomycetota bacterium]
MKALIIAGGFGTRLRPLTDHVPKSLMPIANRPFLEHQVRLLARHGVSEAVLLTGYLAAEFETFIPRAAEIGVKVEISTEDHPLGTAGAVRSRLEDLDDTAIVFNGDVLTDLDVSAMVEFHRARGSALSIALTHVADAGAYGLVPLDAQGRIERFVEKPPPEIAALGGWINAGTYVLEPRVLADIPPDTEWSFEYQVFPSLLERGEPMYGFQSDSYWIDIGTPQRYLQAHFDILSGRSNVEVGGRIIAESQSFADGTTIEAPCLLDHAPVRPGAVIGPMVCLGAGALVGAGARIERSVIHEEAEIGERAVVRDSIVGRGVRVEDDREVVGVTLA